jgi:NhaP-type Na+/H+ or K+/H+ antiporter
VDIALGLVLFDLGRRMDLAWFRRDWTLAASAVGESALAFAAVFATLLAFDFTPVLAGLAAAIAMATSPAVTLLVVQDSRAEGQVTERAFTLVAFNSLLASVVVTMLLGTVHMEVRPDLATAVLHPLYLFAGSLALGGGMASLARWLARRVDRSPELHFTLLAGLVLAAVGLALAARLRAAK